jgi:hypothetical protein
MDVPTEVVQLSTTYSQHQHDRTGGRVFNKCVAIIDIHQMIECKVLRILFTPNHQVKKKDILTDKKWVKTENGPKYNQKPLSRQVTIYKFH